MNTDRLTERFLRYVKINTQSDPDSSSTPSSDGQMTLLRMVYDELLSLGIAHTVLTTDGYIYAHIPPSEGYEDVPAVGFIAHADTSPDYTGDDVRPQIHENYNGTNINLPGSVILRSDFPHLGRLIGKTLVTSDGTTLLGADDKAGIAEIVEALSRIKEENIPHGRVCVCITPDEEIGRGVDHFNTDMFGAKFAYTLDGSQAGEIEYECFNAASADIEITGRNVHPGSAKGVMVNAAQIAAAFDYMLGTDKRPENTDGYEGFYHLCSMEGDVEFAKMHYIIRDHDSEKLKQKIAYMQSLKGLFESRYNGCTVDIDITKQYKNMAEILKAPENAYVLEIAREAIAECALEPVSRPIRGGTDGARISFLGIPCPNLGTGGYAFHGRYEHACVEEMHAASDVVVAIVKKTAERYRT